MVGSYGNVCATSMDFKNFNRDLRFRVGKNDADMIIEKFRLKRETSNNTFFYEYKQDKDGHLTSLFWVDATGIRNYSIFGDTLSFDPTYRTNEYCMVFIPFIGVDNHWSNVTFAAALIENESHTSIKWALDAFDKCMDHIPPCVITDQCCGIKKAISLVWPNIVHRHCKWHIMNKFSGKIRPSLASNKMFMDKMKSFIWADHLSIEEFEEGWKSVIEDYDLADNDWLNEMYDLRKEWIPAYFNNVEMAGLLRTTSRSESSNFYFQHFLQSGDTFVEFYSKYESAIDKQRYLYAQNNQLSEFAQIPATHLKIEKDAAKIYTLKDVLLNGRLFEVTVRLSDHDVNCECKFYLRKAYLCRHAFASLHRCGVYKIPLAYVETSWIKNEENHPSVLGSNVSAQHCVELDEVKLQMKENWFDVQSCMSIAGFDKAAVAKMRTHVQSMKVDMNELLPQKNGNVDKFVGPKPHSDPCSKCREIVGHNARSCPLNQK
ncbi:hypothetical protein POM88_020853 [Heracleum sosnowskyi]|uniref:SWIM-type domain-containing protein n=1 Tax=Heracleum sosnowskyi TaxID=360622 RepID=A0AAD8MT99_9APIA|nr:hypothetical protein POM88_020853 [Heracleum sosnowskyi]